MPRQKDGTYRIPATDNQPREWIIVSQYDANFGKFVDRKVAVLLRVA